MSLGRKVQPRTAALVAIVMVAGAACQAGSPGSSPTAAPGIASTEPAGGVPATGEVTAAASIEATPAAGGIPHGPLEPGAYTTGIFRPATTFAVGAGWVYLSEGTDQAILRFGDKAHQLTIARLDGDALRYARTNPIYVVGAATAVTIGGLPATETPVTLSATADQRAFYPLAPLVSDGDSTLDINFRGTRARVITVTVAGLQVAILVQRPLSDASGFDAAAQAVLDSMAWH